MRLANITLHPTTTATENNELLDSFFRAIKRNGLKECNTTNCRTVPTRPGGTSIKIPHGHHSDLLIHDCQKQELYLECPCRGCGDHQLQAIFELVEKRLWKNDMKVQLNVYDPIKRKQGVEVEDKQDCCSSKCCSELPCDNTDMCSKLIPTVKKGKSCCTDSGCSFKASPTVATSKDETDTATCCSDESECSKPCCASGVCSRSQSKRNGPYKTDSNVKDSNVRSTFICNAICCASEIPAISNILQPVDGVFQVRVNVPLKNVIVDHDHRVISAADIETILNNNSFGARIERDGGFSENGTVGRSRMFVENICCASEIPAIKSIIEPMDGITGVMINVTTKMVYIDHDCSIVTIQRICDALNEESFGARVEHDHSQHTGALSSFVVSNFSIMSSTPTCIVDLTSYLETIPKEKIERFDLYAKQLTVVHNPLLYSAQKISSEILEKTGITTNIVVDGNEGMIWEFPEVKEENAIIEQEQSCWMRPTVILSGIFWIISMLSFIDGNWEYLKYAGLVSVAFGLPPIAMKASRTLRRCQFDANCLMLFAALGAVALQDFTEAAAVTFLFSLSEWLEVRATRRAREALSAIVNLRPEEANLIHPQTKELIVVPVRAVPVGATVSV
jgi:copper chaperone CopZ